MSDEADIEGDSWKITLPCTRAEAEALDGDITPFAMMDFPPTIVTREIDPQIRDAWELDAYFEGKPDQATCQIIRNLIPSAIAASLNAVPVKFAQQDWITLSQSGLDPIETERFFVHGSHEPPSNNPAITNIQIDAGQAFGTGHHETTEGCLNMLDHMANNGKRFKNIADIGTGTGLLAFVAQHLWPRAYILASDVDPIAMDVTKDNATANRLALGKARGQLSLYVASGTNHPAIRRRTPYDLIIANILAGPLIELAPALAGSVQPGGTLILAGLLNKQKDEVAKAYRRQGMRLAEVSENGDWPTLRLIKRRQHEWQRPFGARGRSSQAPGDYGEW